MPETIAIPPQVPEEKRALLAQVAGCLSAIPGVVAVALGGSVARGMHHPGSDLDIGVYYSEQAPFEIAAIRRAARQFSTDPDPVVTGFYEWGAWVNGGAWIPTTSGRVDFLYRSLEHIQRTIEAAQRGEHQRDYDQQPPHGFYSVTYLAETHICQPLYDPAGRLADLKRQVQVYPPRLKARIIADSLWSGEFTLLFARKFAANGDVSNTAGCLVRTAACLVQALYALNERYFINDKTAAREIAAFAIKPPGFLAAVEAILARIGSAPAELDAAVSGMHAAWQSVAALEGVDYSPKFKV